MLAGIGSALIAFGAFLGLMVALAPPLAGDVVGRMEHARLRRNADLTTMFAAGSGFTGALLLISAVWPWALVTFAAVLAAWLGVLVFFTHRQARLREAWVRFEREADKSQDGRPGRVSVNTAAAFGLAADTPGLGTLASHFMGVAGDPRAIEAADAVQRVAQKEARVSWALRHPFGARSSPVQMARLLIIRLRRLLREPEGVLPLGD